VLHRPRAFRDLQRIGTELGADYVVLAQMKSDAAGVRLIAHLIRTPDQVHVWASTYDRAAFTLAAGARPSLFSAAMLGQLEVVTAFVAASPGIQKTRGPHGLTLLSHARAGGAGAVEVVKYLDALGDADRTYTNEPLTDDDRAAITGTYAFGPGANERLTVTIGERVPAVKREGASPRNLFHLGGRVFHPVGADAVRIRFGAGERAATLTVEDGPVVVKATRE
jgi:hypothetical protein